MNTLPERLPAQDASGVKLCLEEKIWLPTCIGMSPKFWCAHVPVTQSLFGRLLLEYARVMALDRESMTMQV